MIDNQNSQANQNNQGAKAQSKPSKPAKKAATKPTKAKKPQLTPRQAEIRSQTLIRGIDNSVTKIKKEMANIEAARKELPRLVTGLSNQANASGQKAPAKPAQKTQQKPAAKKAAPAKKVPAQKPAASTKKAPAKKGAATPAQNRPTFKEVAIRVLQENGPTERAKLRQMYMEKYGRISSQSTYGVYKNNVDTFRVDDKGIVSLTSGKGGSKSTKDDVDSFVSKVEQDRATATMV